MIDQADATKQRTSALSAGIDPTPGRVAQDIAIARVWDLDSDLRIDSAMPASRDGWELCFRTAAMRGFLPRTIPATSD